MRVLAALVSVAALPAAIASAAVTYSGVLDIPIPTDFGGVYLDIVPSTPFDPADPTGSESGGGTYQITFEEPASWDVNFFFGGIGIAHSPSFNPYRADPSDKLSPVHNLGINTYIDGGTAQSLPPDSPALPPGGSNPLTTPVFGGSGDASGNPATNHLGGNAFQFQSGTEGYLAFILDDGGTSYNGWMRVTLTDDGSPGTIHDWAYDSDPIAIGAIPEPATLVLLIGGGLFGWRRRR